MDNEAVNGFPGENIENKVPLLLVAVCAALSAIMMHFHFLSFLFLAPLGFAALYNNTAAWFTFGAAAVINGVISLVFRGNVILGLDIIYFTSMTFGFTWIMAGGKGPVQYHIRTLYRFIIAAALVSVIFFFIMFGGRGTSGIAAMLGLQAEAVSSMLIASAGADAARRSFLEQTLTAERILEIFGNITMRGGAMASMLFMFYINRRMAIAADRIARKRRTELDLLTFYVPVNTIWCLSFSIAGVLLTRIINFQLLEVLAWNVFVVCVILFLAQGAGIVMFTLAKQTFPPMLRLFVHILIFVIILSPGINTVALAALVLIGIAENWLPLRAIGVQKKDGTPPTPGE